MGLAFFESMIRCHRSKRGAHLYSNALFAERSDKKGIKNEKLCFLRFFLKIVFAGTANRAFPIIRYIFPFGSGLYAAVRVALGRIIHITANGANITVHNLLSSCLS
jgi:hypothetical protein